MKVCPRCSYVDIEGRRVCLACRGSLMGTPERDLLEALELREQAHASGDDTVRAPWGPGLKAVVEQAGRDLAACDTRPRHDAPPPAGPAPGPAPGAAVARAVAREIPPAEPPRPTRSPGNASVEPDLRVLDEALAPVARSATTAIAAEPVLDRAGHLTDLDDSRRVAAARPDDEAASDPARQARAARGRAARPTFSRATAVRSALGREKQPPPRRAAQATPESRTASTRTRTIRRAVGAAMVLAVAFFGVRAVRAGLERDDQAIVADPSTPLDKLPWRVESFGPVRVRVPADPTVRAGSSYHRFTLPDVELALAVRPAIASLTTDLALRTYTGQLVTQLGGRYVDGRSQSSSIGVGFSAETQVDGRRLLVYVLSTPEAVVEVHGDVLDPGSARATAIFDRIVNSIEVG